MTHESCALFSKAEKQSKICDIDPILPKQRVRKMPCRFSGSAAEWHWTSFSTFSSGHKDPIWTAYLLYGHWLYYFQTRHSLPCYYCYNRCRHIGLQAFKTSNSCASRRPIATKLDLACRACFITAHFERRSGCLVFEVPKNQINP